MESAPVVPLQDVSTLQRTSRRARNACELCRWRKVRCDAHDGKRCSNCVFENVRCVLTPKRPRKARNRPETIRFVSKPQIHNVPEPISQPNSDSLPKQNIANVAIQPRHSPPLTESSTSVSNHPFGLEDPDHWKLNDLAPSPSLSHKTFVLPDRLTSAVGSQSGDLPAYIKPLPANIGTEDIEYLRIKGALSIPGPDLLHACLQSYFLNVQPIFPAVDSSKVLSIIRGDNPDNEKLSLLVLQALIFVGSTWVDVRLVRKLGFLSRKAFRKNVHEKLRLLYGADCEDDRLCLVQTFALWTFWWEGPNEHKDAWHWIGVALSTSRTIGLQRDPQELAVTTSIARLRKRVWWVLKTRDVIGSYGLNRTPRIKDTDHNVPMLTMEDFDLEPLPAINSGTAPLSSSQLHKFARLCIAWVQVVHIFGRILAASYPETESGTSGGLYSDQQLEGTNVVTSKKTQLQANQLKTYEKELSNWRHQVPEDIWHAKHIPSESTEVEKAELAHRALLSMFYYAVLMNLHRPQIQLSNSTSLSNEPDVTAMQENSRAIIRFAAQQVTDIAMDFYVANMVESLSATCVSCLIPVSIQHVFEMASNDRVVRREATLRVEQCKAIFQAFSDQQFAGPWSLHIMNYIISRVEYRKTRKQMNEGSEDSQSSHAFQIDEMSAMRPAATGISSPTRAAIGQTSACMNTRTQRSDRFTSTNGVSCMVTRDQTMVEAPPTPPLSTVRNPNSATDTSLPTLMLDETLPDDLTDFLGPESLWLDFLSPSEQNSGLTWTESTLL